MTKLVIFCDGSEYVTKNKHGHHTGADCGYGIVAHHNGDTDEVFGGYRAKAGEVGYYELMAFAKSVEYAEAHGYVPKEVSFYTDDAFVSYAGFHLWPGNYSTSRHGTTKRLRTFQKLFYPNNPEMMFKLVRWLTYSRVQWVKGHANTTGNRRADLLARSGVKNLLGHKDYSTEWGVPRWLDWLFQPRTRYTHNKKVFNEYLPFCNPQSA